MEDSISVEQLVKNAEDLVGQRHYRAAVMEAMTALEERANEVVFQLLETRRGLPPDLVVWLKEKTKYSFHEKLHPIGAFALGKPIKKGEHLWNGYTKARKLRNDVSHTAINIEESDARFVIETVKQWLFFLAAAKDVKASNDAPDLTMEFLSLYAILASRFRFPKGGKPVPIALAASNAEKRGQLSPEAVQLILVVLEHRDKVAEGVPIQPDTLSELVLELRILMRELKGIELDASPIDGDEIP